MVIQQPQYTLAAAPTTWTGYDWSCRINGNPTGDPEASLTVNGGGAAVDLLDGMTVLISSVGYGHWDSAVVHVRGDQTVGPATTTLNISTSSEIRGHVMDGDYVVVLDEFRFRQRYGRIVVSGADVVWYKDWDIEWDDLGANDPGRRLAMMPPVPIMGPHAVKFVDPPGTAAEFYFDWSDSYATAVLEAVDSWDSWGETDHAGGTWTYNADATPGWQTVDAISGLRGFRVVLEVDDGNGNGTTLPYRRGVRYVFTLRRPGETQAGDPENAEPLTEFALAEPVAGNAEQGYWRTRVTVYASEASNYNIMPEALVVLFTEDTYTSDCAPEAGSVGPIPDRENILLVGRIIDGTIRKDPETGDVTFDVASPGAEAATYHNYPIVIQSDDAGSSWIDTPSLTVDRAVRYYITWHTTMSLIADVYQTGDTKAIYAQDFLEGDIYSTLNGFLYDRLFARLLCDKYGRFFCEVDAQEQAFGTVPTLFTMLAGDWVDEVNVRQYNQSQVNAVDCGGLIFAAGVVTPKLSRAPGVYDKYRGSRQESTALAITGQAALNISCGRHLNALNYEFEADFQLAGNWRYADIAPQRVVNVGALVTDRQTLTGNYIIRAVSNSYLPVEGCIFTDIETEQEMDDGVPGVTIVIPDEMPDVNYDPEYHEGFGGVEPLGEVPQEPPGGGNGGIASGQFYTTQYYDTEDYWTDDITANPPVWNTINHLRDKNKTCLMPSATTNRFFGYGWGIWEYSPLPFDTGAWAETQSELELATLLGHELDYNEVYIFRMQFSNKPNQEAWAWAGVWLEYLDGSGDEHVIIGCLHTRNAWNTILYATELCDLEEDVDCTSYIAVGQEAGLALDMHSNIVYIAISKEPEEDGGGAPSFSGWWRLYRSQNFGFSFTLAQEGGPYVWGVDGWSTGRESNFCDVWVPWVSNTYQGGTVFWTTTLMDLANNVLEQEYPLLVYRSLNYGLSYDNIGDDGGDLKSGLNFLGGPYNSLHRVYGGISTYYGKDANETIIYTWRSGYGWTEFRDTAEPNHGNVQAWIVAAQTGYALKSGFAYQEPYFVQGASDTDKLCTEDDVFWMTYSP